MQISFLISIPTLLLLVVYCQGNNELIKPVIENKERSSAMIKAESVIKDLDSLPSQQLPVSTSSYSSIATIDDAQSSVRGLRGPAHHDHDHPKHTTHAPTSQPSNKIIETKEKSVAAVVPGGKEMKKKTKNNTGVLTMMADTGSAIIEKVDAMQSERILVLCGHKPAKPTKAPTTRKPSRQPTAKPTKAPTKPTTAKPTKPTKVE
jgi:hypothetical protein